MPPWMMGQRVWRLPARSALRQLGVPRRRQPVQPPERPLHPFPRELVRRLARHHVIERHRDVGAQRPLDLHRALGGERAVGAVDVALELDAVLGDLPEPLEREDLEAARVGEHRAAPRW